MRKNLYCLFLAIASAMTLSLTSCSDNEPDGPTGIGHLTVNGVEWPISTSAPNYDDIQFCYWGMPKGSKENFIILWRENLTDVEVGDDVSTDLIFPLQDLYYEYTDGSITVKKIQGNRVTLEFDDVEYEYTGDYLGHGFHERSKEYQPDHLTVSGTIELIYNTGVSY